MLKTSIVTNTWQCDNCAAEVVGENNSMYAVTVSKLSKGDAIQIDLCEDCVGLTIIQAITDYKES